MREKPLSGFRKYAGPLAAALGFLSAFLFFQFAYPYHLIKREQANLFVYDGDYIAGTYRGMGWLVRFVADFLEQFFHLPVAGPLVVALLVTGIGIVVYRILRRFLGVWPSLGVAVLAFAWAFLRETGNIYTTRYTVVVLGYLALILAALQFKKAWLKVVAAVLFLAFGVWALGSPYHKYYGTLWNTPIIEYDRMIGLDAEVARENWDKVLKLSKKDLYTVEASFCYNLAHAVKGNLGSTLFNHSQGKAFQLLPPVSIDRSAFSDCLAAEAWLKEQGVPFFWFQRTEEWGIDFATDFFDEAHVNLAGGTKITKALAEYALEHVELASHKGDRKYASWEKDYQDYLDYLKKHDKKKEREENSI